MEDDIKSENSIVILPDDIIFDQILQKLPIKHLLRFKCVSKLWNSTISSPQFAKTHLKKTSSFPYQFLLYTGTHDSKHQFTSVTFNEHGRVEDMVKLNPLNYDGGEINVVGCCNGLVCFYDSLFEFYVWNPVTGIISGPNQLGYQQIISASFVYVASVDDYKIVCLLGENPSNKNLNLPRSVYVFSFRSNSWDELKTNMDVDGIAVARADVPVLIDDTLYWSAKNATISSNNDIVIGVNLVNGQLSKIPVVLNTPPSSRPHVVKLFKMKGRLSLCSCNKMYETPVWMLRRDGVSWMLLHYLILDKLDLLSMANDGKCLVHKHLSIAHPCRRLMLVDPSQMFLRKLDGGVDFRGHVSGAWDYKMTLLFPN